jgi:hypothetical protein
LQHSGNGGRKIVSSRPAWNSETLSQERKERKKKKKTDIGTYLEYDKFYLCQLLI